MKTQYQMIRLATALGAILVVSALGSGQAAAQYVITEIIDSTGDGAGNILAGPRDIAVDAAGNVYVPSFSTDNAFKITPAEVITEIIDATGDGTGNFLSGPWGIAVDTMGNVYVAGRISNNVFKITPAGVITEIIDFTGDGMGIGLGLESPRDIAVDADHNVYVTGSVSNSVFKIAPDCNTNGIDDATDIATSTSQDCNANGIPDECETDSDGDGTPDDCDNCPNDRNKTDPGICGCGVSDVDTDGDGAADCNDNCPALANEDQADSDGDGVGDVCEPPPAGQTTADDCGCGNGMDGMMVMPMTLLGIGWMRRRRLRCNVKRSKRHRGPGTPGSYNEDCW